MCYDDDLQSLGAFLEGEGDWLSRTHPRRSAARRTSSAGGEACPSRGCHVGRAVQFVGPAPTPKGALGGRQAPAGYGPATDASAFAQPP